MSSLDKWRAYVEAHKFNGPTVKLLKLPDGSWAILDHEYNLCAIASDALDISYLVISVDHPPQRERPKPVLYEEGELYHQRAERERDVSRMSINTEDLDI